ncbi:hypothetical protein HZH66_007126 [Vespula vulgaris]|uniref:Uncharacterized protein n=1 Tax=Vespula vulgaris TaxID=7454 RepID=A0A834JWZ6_VESVU|nr:hypothetical protein HZH66_007126 [Vespula vulgaris]
MTKLKVKDTLPDCFKNTNNESKHLESQERIGLCIITSQSIIRLTLHAILSCKLVHNEELAKANKRRINV